MSHTVAAAAYRLAAVAEPENVDRALKPIAIFDGQSIDKLPVLEEFRRTGCFQLRVPPQLEALNKAAFNASRRFFALSEEQKARHNSAAEECQKVNGGSTTAPGSLNGYHSKGGLSRYNEHRSGFIFEGETVLDLLAESTVKQCVSESKDRDKQGQTLFVEPIAAWRVAMHSLAAELLARLAVQLLGPAHRNYFQDDLSFFGSGQLHFKRTHFSKSEGATQDPREDERIKHILLLPHTDPSLISLVVHDCESSDTSQEVGAMGLEVYRPEASAYEPLRFSGWNVVTVFLGDVLVKLFDVENPVLGTSYKNELAAQAPKHRVALSAQDMTTAETNGFLSEASSAFRHAATIFVQPHLEAPMRNPMASINPLSKKNAKFLTYGGWRAKVYARYYTRKGKRLAKHQLQQQQPG